MHFTFNYVTLSKSSWTINFQMLKLKIDCRTRRKFIRSIDLQIQLLLLLFWMPSENCVHSLRRPKRNRENNGQERLHGHAIDYRNHSFICFFSSSSSLLWFGNEECERLCAGTQITANNMFRAKGIFFSFKRKTHSS